MVFEILERKKNKLKILIGNIVTTISDNKNYLYRPIWYKKIIYVDQGFKNKVSQSAELWIKLFTLIKIFIVNTTKYKYNEKNS